MGQKAGLEETSLMINMERLERIDILKTLPKSPVVHNSVWPYDSTSSSI